MATVEALLLQTAGATVVILLLQTAGDEALA